MAKSPPPKTLRSSLLLVQRLATPRPKSLAAFSVHVHHENGKHRSNSAKTGFDMAKIIFILSPFSNEAHASDLFFFITFPYVPSLQRYQFQCRPHTLLG